MSVSVKNDDNEALESKIKKEQKQFQEIVDIAGETVYVFLQFERIFIEGWIIAIATVLFQCFFVYFFLAESFQCGLDGGSNCFVNTLTGSSGDPAVTNKTTQVGLVTGCIVAVLFLTPDFMKGIVSYVNVFWCSVRSYLSTGLSKAKVHNNWSSSYSYFSSHIGSYHVIHSNHSCYRYSNSYVHCDHSIRCGPR